MKENYRYPSHNKTVKKENSHQSHKKMLQRMLRKENLMINLIQNQRKKSRLALEVRNLKQRRKVQPRKEANVEKFLMTKMTLI